MPKGAALETFLQKSISKYPDIRSISLCSSEGTELCCVNREDCTQDESYNLVPSFTVSAEQSSRLRLGNVVYTIVWNDRSIVLQFKVELVVVSVLLEESANIGIMDEFIPLISETLKPFCVTLSANERK
mmetsp:Transcript_10531/g.16006  ORF Transcript_10531/g.16006 Transcript_10531/m.16006 type:complete len:129 (-) Transcript_10531:137-523(-)|eukprot:CAMPEP_0185017406 /NCGR_PEP_ID=MMETSP1103-20130426/371_1 /TAXON_ID=36769 /ORGANISM="Paraphysomonas bandaiensis, Strain Caron Lab Isolate" /LENGTH=128 /DNA_ID=CAMNT_0027546815 /DNA_START=120 /DNA_END=506 /DNA_ORIENTATION=-